MTWHAMVLEILKRIDSGEITGSKTALARVRGSRVAIPMGTNSYRDEVFDLGRLPREQGEKRLSLHKFTRPNATGALYRGYVATAP